VGGTIFFVGLAAFFFFVYGRRKAPQAGTAETVEVARSG